jgi:hypothetical protein
MPSPLPAIRVQPTPNGGPSRRSFLRYTGASAALGSLWLASCSKKEDPAAVVSLPIITSFTPTSAMPGASVTITGTSLSGVTAVALGTLPATFTVVNDTSVTFIVPAGAQSGPIKLTTPGGTATTTTSFTVTTTTPTTVSVGTGDVGVLNYAYALEQLEAEFYRQVRTGAYYTGSTITPAEKAIFDDLYYHEVIHREFLKAALSAAGATPLKDLTVDFSSIDFSSRTAVLNAARAFEDLGSAAYIGAGQYITSTQNLYLAGKIASVEARHASLIRDLVTEGTFVGNDVLTITTAGTSSVSTNNGPAGSSLERALSPTEVVAVANNFLATGSKLDVSGIR